ncbi:MAG: hypothetical protein KGI54_12320 [Pseudomonadota bacterium]|nr:hypothetical protein [Pseudomonadota bacterium]
MGSTVTVGKKAYAFKPPSGEIVYAIFENTYEKNCYPHTPHWGCCGIGNIAQIMRRIFLAASICEGGSLQGKKGWISPEGYIKGWLKELDCPIEMADKCITIKMGNRFYDAISQEGFAKISVLLQQENRQDIVDRLERGEEIALSLYADAQLIVTLCNQGKVSSWRLIPSAPYGGECNTSLGYHPVPAIRYEMVTPSAYRIDINDDCIIRQDDGSWHCEGSEYSIVEDYIAHLWQSEILEPGSYRNRIRNFRNAMKLAPKLPSESVKISVDLTVEMSQWNRKQAESLPQKYPSDIRLTENGYEITALTKENAYWVTGLRKEATWIFEEKSAVKIDSAYQENLFSKISIASSVGPVAIMSQRDRKSAYQENLYTEVSDAS